MKFSKLEIQQAIKAGFVATLVLTLLMYLAPLIGLPNLDMGSAIGSSLVAHKVHPGAFGWFLGLLVFLVMGSVLSPILFLYALPALSTKRWLRGLEWGVLVWAFGGVFVMLYMGIGLNEAHMSHPHWATLASFTGHIAYGVVLGLCLRRATA